MGGCVLLVRKAVGDVYEARLFWARVQLASVYGSRRFVASLRAALAPSSTLGVVALRVALLGFLDGAGVVLSGDDRQDHRLFTGQEPSNADPELLRYADDDGCLRDSITGFGPANDGPARTALRSEFVDSESGPPSSKTQPLGERV